MSVLIPFSSHDSIASLRLKADLIWAGSLLEIRFVLTGVLNGVIGLCSHRRGAAPTPTEGLWESTCFEAFFGPEGSTVYYEVNAAADGRWMVFRFEKERIGRTPQPELRPEFFSAELRADRFEMILRFDVSSATDLADRVLIAAPSAVLEETSGERSYWALVHSTKPDFHNPAHRLLTLKP